MTPGCLSGRFVRSVMAFAAVFPAFLSGCGEAGQYAADLQYAVRTDYLVLTIPKLQPVAYNSPGKLPLDYLNTLPLKYDASRKIRAIDYAKIEQMVKNKSLSLDENQKTIIEESKTNIIDPRNLTKSERSKIGELLVRVYGTPAAPTVKVKDDKDQLGIPKEASERLQLDSATLAEGSKLYRRHCLHCHGLEGNGRGPTGYWVNPHPRDYRQGVFKFTSSTQDLGERKPRRDDLMHVLVHGIEGSSMPSFGMYPREDLNKIISYVMHLSMRGEIEYYVINKWFQESKLADAPTSQDIESARASMLAEGKSTEEIQKAVKEYSDIKSPSGDEEKSALAAMDGIASEAIDGFIVRWVAAQDSAITPDPYPYEDSEDALLASAARGATLFNSGTASCVSCHKNYGREAPYYYDAWGTVVRPRDLIDGFYRGGRRPVDMYNRVWSGINGAGMATYDKELRPNDADKAAKQDKIWDLVNFMQVLHYPDLRAKLKAKHGVQVD